MNGPANAAGPRERERRAERIGAAVTALPDVAGLSAGPRAQVVTYRIGLPYTGVAVRDGEIEVGVVARRGRPLPQVADAVRGAVLPLAGGLPVNVLIADIQDDSSSGGSEGS
ncbi:hypothetical protein Acsp03_60790 [Actinomadura sp. NBRC 104412]|uniref:hypothetical protein n=1 Tax=Actinomadura sp. NBRC 104412 TaxID=3032203 RepID=UPI0024A4CC31|nr:hypothetical protein [Actinomadura sp. NBRC 104412]GLZ08613.1 hypothetical protein Acsp03_60790 [Actinomadura sp. NBRC 104412]